MNIKAESIIDGIVETKLSPKQIFKRFWKPIICNKLGFISRKKVMNELADYYFMLDQVPKVYSEVTRGILSKPNYPAETVITVFNEQIREKADLVELLADDWDLVTGDCKTNKDYKNKIFEYLDITN